MGACYYGTYFRDMPIIEKIMFLLSFHKLRCEKFHTLLDKSGMEHIK